jgi:NAD(P)-dependent dehydrogenase (short-subunit alcohol dehydrogenase family)
MIVEHQKSVAEPRPNPDRSFPQGAALVIGGSGGIGRAICHTFAKQGSDVAFTFRTNEIAAKELLDELAQYGVSVQALKLDLADRNAMVPMVDSVASSASAIHSVVYAAGIDISMTYVSNVDPDEWQLAIDSELGGFFNLIKAVLPVLRTQGGGSIVAVTSAGIHRHPPLDILSVAPKAAIESLVRAIAREEGRFKIRANSVAPGVIDAGLFDRLRTRVTPEFVKAMERNTALKRFGTVEEVSQVVAFLCSNASSYVTGQSICVDGGYSV